MSNLQGYDAALFDLDGVITRTATLHAAAWKRLFDEFLASLDGRSPDDVRPFQEEDYRLYVDGRPRYDGVAAFLASRGIELPRGTPDDSPSAPTSCGLGNRKNAYFADELAARGVETYADTLDVIERLAAQGTSMAVVSASENCDAMLERAGLMHHFAVRVTGVETARWQLPGKPAPDTFLKAAEMLGVPPGRAIVFEDAISGVQAGKAGGFGLVIGVDRHGEPHSLIDGGADIVVEDVRDVLRLETASSPVAPHPAAPTEATRFEGVAVVLPADQENAPHADIAALAARLREQGATVEVTTSGGMAAAVERLVDDLAVRGVGTGLLLIVGWLGHLTLPSAAGRAHVVALAPDAPASACVRVLRQHVERRDARLVPSIDADPAWCVTIEGDDPGQRRAHQSLLTVADSVFGTRGVREEDSSGSLPRVVAAGVFDEAANPPTLLEGPNWTSLHLLARLDTTKDRRTLDLRTGVLVREQPADPVPLRTMRFASLSRPGCFALRAEGAVDWLHAGSALTAPATDGTFVRRQEKDRSSGESRTDEGGSIAAAAVQSERQSSGRRIVDRLVAYVADADGGLRGEEAAAQLAEAERLGIDGLLAEQRVAWAQRWDEALVCIDGDAELELGVRFDLFHLMASVATAGEAALGARGVAGPAYRGHVFWDADVFALPFFAATHPAAARAMLEYRIRRLAPALREAEGRGLRGARFPWESAHSGVDVTPTIDQPPHGPPIPIYTGEHEEHIASDVAWAAWQYAAWTGDDAFLRPGGAGRALVLETARYWASRVRLDADGRGHIDDVIGPDEYHERVDDNVFTNVMARWNLLRGVELAEEGDDVAPEEIAQWRGVAAALVDNYDATSGLYEQFTGFYALDPLVIADLAETPVAADLLFGRDRISSSQVIKQPDVLMLHHLVPEETAPGSLRPNLAFYEPRCAHGSSLSPAIHSALFARDGRPDDAVRLFRMACRLDLDNLTGTTAGGLHIATSGGVWQALVFGFLGMRAERNSDVLRIDPQIPAAWNELRLRLRHRGRRIEVRAAAESFVVATDAPLSLLVPGASAVRLGPGTEQRWRRAAAGWEPR